MSVTHKYSMGISQGGVALLSVLMLLVLLSTMAIYHAEDQNLAIKRVSNLREAEQSYQIAASGEHWAVKILEKDMAIDNQDGIPNIDHILEDWANLGPPVKVEGTESFLQVGIFDNQSKFNLNNLIQGKPAPTTEKINANGDENNNQSVEPGSTEEGEQPEGEESAPTESETPKPASWYQVFQKLLLGLRLDPLLADVVVDWIDEDSNTTGTSGAEDLFYSALKAPYRAANQQLSSLAELDSLRGFTPQIIAVLSNHVTAIPLESSTSFTKINVNTASAVVLRALTEDPLIETHVLSPAIDTRMQKPFESVSEFIESFGTASQAVLSEGITEMLDVKSDYFTSRSCARTGKVNMSHISQLRKNRASENVKVNYRQKSYGCPELNVVETASASQNDPDTTQ